MNVPFLDLRKQYLSLKEPLDKAWRNVVEEAAFIKGKYVTEFESAFSKALAVKNCVGVANGTDAIYVILKSLGIGKGDEVITAANSWISSSETITQTGASCVFADVETGYYCIDPELLEEKISSRTKALIVVHLYGQSAEMEKISRICKKHNLFLIEDCAQSHFTMYKDQPAGTFGIAASFSFYPGKNLGAYGDAGAIISNDDRLAEKMRMYANHGALTKHRHVMEGINSRLDGLQAAILLAKLPRLKEWNAKRNKLAENYSRLLAGVNQLGLPKTRPQTYHSWHLYVIRLAKRDEMKEFLKEKGIETQIHYPAALPFLKAYDYLGHTPRDFPVASQFQSEILSLPMFPELENEQQEYVAGQIKNFYSK
jgi:dTDP-4-amino-4,6-dideoxygalactose transaminase